MSWNQSQLWIGPLYIKTMQAGTCLATCSNRQDDETLCMWNLYWITVYASTKVFIILRLFDNPLSLVRALNIYIDSVHKANYIYILVQSQSLLSSLDKPSVLGIPCCKALYYILSRFFFTIQFFISIYCPRLSKPDFTEQNVVRVNA